MNLFVAYILQEMAPEMHDADQAMRDQLADNELLSKHGDLVDKLEPMVRTQQNLFVVLIRPICLTEASHHCGMFDRITATGAF